MSDFSSPIGYFAFTDGEVRGQAYISSQVDGVAEFDETFTIQLLNVTRMFLKYSQSIKTLCGENECMRKKCGLCANRGSNHGLRKK